MLPPLCRLLLFVCERIFYIQRAEVKPSVKNYENITAATVCAIRALFFQSFFEVLRFLMNSSIAPFSIPAHLSTSQHSAVANIIHLQQPAAQISKDCMGERLGWGKTPLFDQKLYADGHICDHKTSLRDTSSATESYFYFFVFL